MGSTLDRPKLTVTFSLAKHWSVLTRVFGYLSSCKSPQFTECVHGDTSDEHFVNSLKSTLEYDHGINYERNNPPI